MARTWLSLDAAFALVGCVLLFSAPTSLAQTCTKQDGQNNGGTNLLEADGVWSPEDCCAKCTENSDCKGYTWIKGTSKCYLKSSIDGLKSDDAVVSGCIGDCPTPTPGGGGATYCPKASDDFLVDYTDGGHQWTENGWSITGGSRVSSKAAFNMLGGFLEFDMDLSGAHGGVNANVYTSSLNGQNCGKDCYCDAPNGGCMELDFVEANGNCAFASTWHTTMVGGQNCDVGGCQHVGNLGNQVHVHVDFSNDGWMTPTINGEKLTGYDFNPSPSPQDASALASTMQSKGAVIESSQWTGWVPGNCGGDGNLAASNFKVSNVKVQGTVVNGPEPTLCASPPTQPPTTTTAPVTPSPATTTTSAAVPSDCKDSYPACPGWAQAGNCDDDRYRNFMKTNCKKSCGDCHPPSRTSQLIV